MTASNRSRYLKRSGDKRDVDDKLLETAKEWLGSKERSGWISIVSAPGRGNSRLLRHFRESAEAAGYTLADTRVIIAHATARPPGRETSALAPIARAVLELYSDTWTARASQFLTKANWATHVIASIAAVWIMLVVKLRFEESKHGLLDVAFWRELVPGLGSNPAQTISILIVSVLAELLIAYTIHKMQQGAAGAQHRERDSQTPETARRQLSFSRYRGPFVTALEALCRSRRAMILLVDNAQELPEDDKALLNDLFQPGGKTAVEGFARVHRILIVTLDFEVDPDSWRRSSNRISIEVPPFTDLELRDIYRAYYPDREPDAFVAVLPAAQRHVRLLFDPSPVGKRAERQFRKRRDEEIGGVFGDCEVMAYWAARDCESITKKDLLDWLNSLDPRFLQAFDLLPPTGIRGMVNRFAGSPLVRTRGQVLYLDAVALAALRAFLQSDFTPMLAQAHYYWANALAPKVDENTTIEDPYAVDPLDRWKIQQAAWHATQVGVVVSASHKDGGAPFNAASNAPDILKSGKLTLQEQDQRRTAMAKLLLNAAAMWRLEGNIKEADEVALDAMEWLDGLSYDRVTPLVKTAVRRLWSSYWLTGDKITREHLSGLATQYPPVQHEPEWLVNLRFEEFLEAKRSLTKLERPPEQNKPSLSNLHTLTMWRIQIRAAHGFVDDALRDQAVDLPPFLGARRDWNGLAISQLHASAAIRRGNHTAFETTMTELRSNTALELEGAPLFVQAFVLYHMARYWHLLCDFWQTRRSAIDEQPEEQRPAEIQSLKEAIARLVPELLAGDAKLPHALFDQAEACYRRAFQLSMLLRWQMVMLHVTFQLGELILQHTPASRKKKDLDWWSVPVDLFNTALTLEREMNLIVFAPDIHRLRWEFFRHQDLQLSVDDVYNTFQAVKDANFGNLAVLRWHSLAQAQLTNHGHTTEHYKKDADLHELWARELAMLPEAENARTYRYIPFEQAYSLGFVSQALRLAGEMDLAGRKLDEAEQLIRSTETTSPVEDAKQTRELLTGIRMQRAWLLNTLPEGRPRARAMMREIWADVEPGDVHNSNLLGNLVNAEHEEKLLDGAWPGKEGAPIHADPLNPKLSLPADWFEPHAQVSIGNLFEFRLRQLLYMITPRPNPTMVDFGVAAQWRWQDQEKFPETTLDIASLELAHSYARTSRDTIVQLLQVVAFYFRAAEPEDENELNCLKLLIGFDPKSFDLRLSYVKVLSKHMELLRKAAATARSVEQIDRIGIARRADYLLSILENGDQVDQLIGRELRRTGESEGDFFARRERRKAALVQARREFAQGGYLACSATLAPYLLQPKALFIALNDLEALDLWLRCAVRISTGGQELANRSLQFRELVHRYIAQFSRTIPEKDVQRLALELLESLDRGPSATALAAIV